MKKKIFSLCLVLALAATAIVGGTLAYFTDTDSKDNTFTTAKVKIELIEQQRNDAGNALEDFENDKVLLPIVGSAQGDKVTVDGVTGLPTAANYVDKILTIKNLEVDAYVRLYIAIPEALDNVTDAGKNVLHFDWAKESTADGQWGQEELVGTSVDIDGLKYNVYYRTYNSILAKDDVTATPAYIGFYLDKGVDVAKDRLVIDENLGLYTQYTINGEDIAFNFEEGVKIPVYAVGVQASGFKSADEAVVAAFGENFNPWTK